MARQSSKKRPFGTPLFIIAATAAASTLTRPLQAVQITYDGGPAGTGSSWNDPTNWAGDVLPGATDSVGFTSAGTGTGTKVISLDASQTIYQLTIPAFGNQANFTIGSASDVSSNYTLTLTNVFRDANVGGVETIAANVNLAANSTWNILNGYNGNVAVTGNIGSTNAVVFTKDGANLLVLNGANTFTGSARVLGGTLSLGGTNAYAGVSTVSGGTLTLNFAAGTVNTPATNILNNASTLVLGGVRGGGTVTLTGKASTTNSQTVGGVTISAGASAFTIANSSTANPSLFALGGITHTVGGTVNFTQPANGVVSATNGYTTSTANVNGILGAWATVANNDWATNNGTNLVAYTGYTDLAGATPSIVDAAASNVRVDSATSTGDIGQAGGTTTINTLLVKGATARVVTVGAGNTLRFGAAGGVLTQASTGVLTLGASGNAGTITAGGADDTAGELIIANATAVNVNSVIANNGAGAVSLTKSGSGILSLLSQSTNTGVTTVNNGVLSLGANTTLSSTTNGTTTVTMASTAGLAVGQTVTGTGITAGTKIATVNIDGVTLTLTKAASTSATSNFVYYTGGTTNQLSTTGDIVVTGGTLELGSTSAAQTTSGNVRLMNGTLSNGTLTKSGTNYDIRNGSITTKLAGSVGLDKTTSGALVFNNSVSNTYTGDTTITEGSVTGGGFANVIAIGGNLIVGSASGGPAASYTNANSAQALTSNKNVTVYSNGTVAFGGGAQAMSGTISIFGGSVSGTQVYFGSGAALNMTGGTFGANAYVSGFTVTINASPSSAYITSTLTQSTVFDVANGAAAVDLSDTGSIGSGSSVITKRGAGFMLLASGGTNNVGSVVLNLGTLLMDFANNPGATPTNMVNAAAVLTLGGGNLQIKQKTAAVTSQTFASTTINAGGSSVTGTSLDSNGVTIALGALTQHTGGTINVVLPTNGAITTTTANDASGLIGPWASTGTGIALQYAANDGSNNIVAYTGATAGSVDLSNMTSATTNYSFGSAVTQSGAVLGHTLRYTGSGDTLANAGFTTTLDGLMNAGTGTLTVSGTGNVVIGANKELVVLSNTQDVLISSNIVNNGANASALTYSGGGTLTLAGTNAYTGATTVALGRVLVNGAQTGSAVTVAGAGTLGGIGSVGTVTVAQGGTISPGSTGPGKLTIAGNFLLKTGRLAIDLAKTGNHAPTAGTDYDQVAVTGTPRVTDVTGGSLILSVGDFVQTGEVYYIVDDQGAGTTVAGTFTSALINGTQATGTFTQNGTFSAGGYSFMISYNGVTNSAFSGGGNDIALQVSAVPEPSVAGLLFCGATGLLARRRRKMNIV